MKSAILLLALCLMFGDIQPPKCVTITEKVPVYVFVHAENKPPTSKPVLAPIPTPTVDPPDPPSADYSYACYPGPGEVCINSGTPDDEAIAIVVDHEGGQWSYQMAANIMQVIANRMAAANANPTADERASLAVNILSKPYISAYGRKFPGFNEWAIPFPMDKIMEYKPSAEMFDHIQAMVDHWIVSGEVFITTPDGVNPTLHAVDPIRWDPSVMFFFSSYDNSNSDLAYVSRWVDRVPINDDMTVTMYYSNRALP